jgi:tRNA dimethylallyltransferase
VTAALASRPAILLIGPTASGKTALACELADRFPVDIISVDSAMVYRGMDIGTAKPDVATQARYPHALIDLLSPEESYSAARFCADARDAAERSWANGRVPLLTGGTMLYVRALLEGLSAMPAAHPELREQIETEAHLRGWPALHAELARVDANTAARLKPNDSQRIGRALEVYRASGVPMSQWHTQPKPADSPFGHLLQVGLMPSDRAVLHDRIAARFDAMLAAGLVEEVRGLRARHTLSADLPSMRCVGYRQVWEFLETKGKARDLRDKGIAATRQLAKRQMTWMRAMGALELVDPLSAGHAGEVIARAAKFIAAAQTG